jgi:hypothetical protein
LIVADNGSDMYISGAFDPRWNNDVLNPAFRALSASDFEVIELGWRGGRSGCTAPGPPQTLASTVSGQFVQLNWAPPVAGGQQEYILEAGSSSGLSNLASYTLTNTASFSATAPQGTYYVRARARNACGTSAPSNEVILSVGGCPVLAAPSSLSFTRNGSLVTLNWNTVVNASGYMIEVGSSPGQTNVLGVAVSPSPLSATAPPGTYYVRVRARNGCGAGSASNEVVVVM